LRKEKKQQSNKKKMEKKSLKRKGKASVSSSLSPSSSEGPEISPDWKHRGVQVEEIMEEKETPIHGKPRRSVGKSKPVPEEVAEDITAPTPPCAAEVTGEPGDIPHPAVPDQGDRETAVGGRVNDPYLEEEEAEKNLQFIAVPWEKIFPGWWEHQDLLRALIKVLPTDKITKAHQQLQAGPATTTEADSNPRTLIGSKEGLCVPVNGGFEGFANLLKQM
jgi:hypothetical protein